MRLGRTELSPGILILAAGIWAFEGGRLLAAVISAVLIHEAGHLLAMAAMGGRLIKLRFGPFGAVISCRGLGYGAELVCALTGPLFSILAAYCGAKYGYLIFAGMSMLLGLFNLLPLTYLDGGRALSCLAAMISPKDITHKLYIFDLIFASVLFAVSAVYAVLHGKGAMPAAAFAALLINSFRPDTCKLR